MKPMKNFALCAAVALTIFCVLQCGSLAQLILVVSKDGGGKFTTINQAVAAAPPNSPQRTIIKVKAGVYHEYVLIPKEKPNLYLIGEGMDTTTISGNRSTSMGLQTYLTATVTIYAMGFVAKEITFENTAGPEMGQAVALRSSGDFIAFYRCRFLGYQDTLNPNLGTQFYRDCEVFGTVDFIYGEARVVFQNSKIYARKPIAKQSNTITAQGNEQPNMKSGFVMQNCTISGTSDLMKDQLKVKTFLGRPWRVYSTTVFMQSYLDKLIDPTGWLEWNKSLVHVYYAEFDNQGPGSMTNHRVNWSHVIDSGDRATAAKFTVRNFIEGAKWINYTGIPYYLDLL